MEKYISKSVLVTEIKKKIKLYEDAFNNPSFASYEANLIAKGKYRKLLDILQFIDTLEVKDVDTWHLQEKEDIYDAVKGWDIHTFVCVMKDGTIQKFTGCCDEDYEGHINIHIDGVNDDYDDVDDIVKWIEV